jgi:hypothetical protein
MTLAQYQLLYADPNGPRDRFTATVLTATTKADLTAFTITTPFGPNREEGRALVRDLRATSGPLAAPAGTAILVGGDEACSLRAVLVLNGLRPNVLQFQILQMRTNEQSEVEGAQVGIRTVLYRPAKLRGSRQNHHEHGQDEKNSFLHFTL